MPIPRPLRWFNRPGPQKPGTRYPQTIRLPWMSRAERTQWRAARTLADLAQLTADWWEGTLRDLPGHNLGHRPHPTLTEHAATLAAVNRAGFLVMAARAGTEAPRQRAAVQGFADSLAVIRRLVETAETAGLKVVTDWLDTRQGKATGQSDDLGDRVFGPALDVADLQAHWPRLPHAVKTVAPALQITLTEPQFGSGTLLWDVLAGFADPTAPVPETKCRACDCTGRQNCGDGCSGVIDQDDGRCEACVNPSVLIDWSTTGDGEANECVLCGAPIFSTGAYCSKACEIADADEPAEAAGQSEIPAALVWAEKPDDPGSPHPI